MFSRRLAHLIPSSPSLQRTSLALLGVISLFTLSANISYASPKIVPTTSTPTKTSSLTETPSPVATPISIVITVIISNGNNLLANSTPTILPTQILSPTVTAVTYTPTPYPTYPPQPTNSPTATLGPIEAFVSKPTVQYSGLVFLLFVILAVVLLSLGIPIANVPYRLFHYLKNRNKEDIFANENTISITRLGEEFNIDTIINRKEFDYLTTYIKEIDSGNIALAGPRGIGKTTLMQILLQHDGHEGYVRFGISTPTRYEEREFVLNLFDGLCRSVLKKIQTDERLKSLRLPTSLYSGPEYTWQERLRPIGFIVSLITIVLLWQNLTSVAQAYDNLLRNFGYNVLYTFLFILMTISIAFLVFLIFWGISPTFKPSIAEKIRGVSPELANLFIETTLRLERIGYQQTYQSSRSAEISIAEILKLGSGMGKSLTKEPYTLVGLVADYRDYVHDVTKMFGKIIICIDELDKVLDAEQVREFLRKIKGVFSLRNVYYIVSVSEEAMEAFNLRNLIGKDEVDSTFSIVFDIRAFSTKECKELLQKHNVNNNELENLLSVLSAGVPRDLIRLARRAIVFKEFEKLNSKKIVINFMREIVNDVSDGLKKDEEIDDKTKMLIFNGFAEIIDNLDKPNVEMFVQKIIDQVHFLQRKDIDKLIGVLVRLGVRLKVASYLAANANVLRNNEMCNKFSAILYLVPYSPLEAQEMFDKAIARKKQ